MTDHLPHLHSSHLHSSHLQDLHLPHSHFTHSHLPHLQASLVAVAGTTDDAQAKQLQRMERKAVFIKNLISSMKRMDNFGKNPNRRDQAFPFSGGGNEGASCRVRAWRLSSTYAIRTPRVGKIKRVFSMIKQGAR
jgi:hypothetical protein